TLAGPGRCDQRDHSMDRAPACGRRRARPPGAARSAQVVTDSRSRQSSPGLRLEESRLFAGVRLYQAEVLVGKLGRDTPARRPRQKAELHQKWLVDVLDCLGILRHRHRDGVEPDRSTLVLLDDGPEDATVDGVETEL